ncbi:DUF6415 family natural product biosynthesis protein [Streptomyces sp. NBC_00683]|uniref:DUF6415 family natural product biosynthesis protein n=1 Tax=Streptomyces sp. NBC_00683 TaxID=2903670 RepID=UPI002E36A6CA|nr:DUF6415 family natural product biosynthesis protein [Streptomyces sp. NBC_00683]
MTSVTESHGLGRDPVVVSEASPIDLTGISDSVDEALAITLCMPAREDIDRLAGRLRGALNLFLTEDPGFAGALEGQQMLRTAHRLLELNARPDAETPQFTAFEYVRDLARLTKRFVALYRESHPAEEPND